MHLFRSGFLLALTLAPANAVTYDFVTFTGPGGASISALSINNSGQVAGTFVDSAGASHGFLRSADGKTMTQIDAPGASSTIAVSISNTGWVAGSYATTGTTVSLFPSSHGFRLAPDGITMLTIDVPGATSTMALEINSGGVTMGQYLDVNGQHGFLLAADGTTFTTFDAPFGVGETYPNGMNDNGDVVGFVYGEDGNNRLGWKRSAAGVITTINDPQGPETRALAINNAGQVVGIVNPEGLPVDWGFLLSADGSAYTSIGMPGATVYDQSAPMGINNSGQIIEVFNQYSAMYDGGTYTFVTVPGASGSASGINDSGQVVGGFGRTAANGTRQTYGFVASPMPASTGPAIRTYYGVTGASVFGGLLTTAPGSWIEIYGQNLAADTRTWQASDFTGNSAPTSLDGTSVSIDGQAAYVSYISPGQVNALVPLSVNPGANTVTVTSGGLTSPPETVTANELQPEMLAVNGILQAQFADGTSVSGCGPTPAREAKSGDTIVLYGIGFGPVTPASRAGQVVAGLNSLQASFQVAFGPPVSANVPVTYAGLAPGSVGLYQFNFVVPAIPASDFPSGSTALSLTATWTLNGSLGPGACAINISQ